MINDLKAVRPPVDEITKIDEDIIVPIGIPAGIINDQLFEFAQQINAAVNVTDRIDANTAGKAWCPAVDDGDLARTGTRPLK